MKTLHIAVVDKIATYQQRDGEIVCGNSDYVIEFAFDSEWDEHTDKVARFIIGNHYENVSFSGTTCPIPVITNTTSISVGVYAGDLCTTTPAVIGCKKSILCATAAEGKNPILNGNSAFIRYSANADGANFTTEWSEGQNYIGFATGQSAPTMKEGYEWLRFAQGTIDAELSETSENPVQNKVIAKALNDISVDVPTFDLVSLGLGAISTEGVALETDTTEIMAALDNGAVKFIVAVNVGAEVQAEVVMNKISAQGEYICAYTLDFGTLPLILTLIFVEGGIQGALTEISSGSEITVDTELSDTSENPVQNKVIAEKINGLSTLPEVTAEDNDKILCVSGGAWSVMTISDSPIKTYIDDYINEALGGDY